MLSFYMSGQRDRQTERQADIKKERDRKQIQTDTQLKDKKTFEKEVDYERQTPYFVK